MDMGKDMDMDMDKAPTVEALDMYLPYSSGQDVLALLIRFHASFPSICSIRRSPPHPQNQISPFNNTTLLYYYTLIETLPTFASSGASRILLYLNNFVRSILMKLLLQ